MKWSILLLTRDARAYFDQLIFDESTWHEIVEVLQFSYLFGSRCLGQVLRWAAKP